MIKKGSASKLFKASWVVKNNSNAGDATFYAKIKFDDKKAKKYGMSKKQIKELKAIVKEINEQFKETGRPSRSPRSISARKQTAQRANSIKRES